MISLILNLIYFHKIVNILAHIGIDSDCQVIIGTPKGSFDLKKIKLVVCDDSDVISTTHLMRSHLLQQLSTNCQQIVASATINRSSMLDIANPVIVKTPREDGISPNITQYHIKCRDISEKYRCVKEITNIVSKFGSNNVQSIVFCNVCIVEI